MPRQALVLLLFLAWPALAAGPAALPGDASSLVILAYQRVGEDALPAQSLRAEVFAQHIETLAGRTVLPLPEALQSLAGGEDLPSGAVAVTLEGGYRSALPAAEALEARRIPFTLLYAPDAAGSGDPDYLTWADLRRVARMRGASLGLLPASYARLAGSPHTQALASLNRARAAHAARFGQEANIVSYPFGAWSLGAQAAARDAGFRWALTLDSGAAHQGSDPLALPRFVMTEGYGAPDRLALVLDALPLPVRDASPADPLLDTDDPAIGFTAPDGLDLTRLACFVSGQGRVEAARIGQRVEVRAGAPLSAPRTRLNCTLPGPEGRWRWYGRLFTHAE
ncbi:MAG: polysaccharide deacetylase family protein [Alphaproteobacteria bacterium]|nr:polysaccharide deacetylase family protein [Alphaproteobacteria bacterium]